MKKTAEEILKSEFVDGEWEELMSYMNTDITPSIVGAMDKHADQFKPKWIPVEEMTADTPDTIVMLFDDGSVRRHEEDWPFATATHFFVFPAAPERKEEGE